MKLSETKIGHNNLIHSSLLLFQKTLVGCFQTAVEKTLQDLFSKAEKASSNQQETKLFEQYNLLKNNNSNLTKLLSSAISKMPDEITEQISLGTEGVKLSLVADEELEISLAFTQLESVLDIKFSSYLFALEKRLKVLFASKNITKENMPFGVGSICWVLSKTLDASNSNIVAKVYLIGQLKNSLSIELKKTYELIDKKFMYAGILPNIKPEVRQAKNKKSSTKKEYDLPKQEGYQSTVRPSGVGFNDDVKQTNSSKLVNSIFDLMNQGRVQGSQEADASKLDNNGNNIAATSGAQMTGPLASNIDNKIMDKTLDNLSKVTSVAAGATEIDKLKEMVFDDIRNETGIYYPNLSMQQQNSLDVMGMFYEQVKSDNSIDDSLVSSLNAINIPLIRTAIKDTDFFENTDHPAREYLEKIIHAAQEWHGTSVVKNIHKFSSSVASEYDGTTQSFDQANDDLESYLELTSRRAKKAEEKWVNAAKGKEKLDISRSKVEEVVENISEIAVPEFVKNVIKYVIQDAMTLALLRHGEDSDEWHKNIATSEIIAKMANPVEVKKLTPKQKIESLHHLDETMDELGFSENDRSKTLNNIKECASAATSNELSKDIKLSEVATINKDKANTKKAGSARIEELRELTSQEKSEITKIRLMAYGTLFDFITNQQRDKVRRKLSWFSPVSNKVLFVSLLGKQPYEKSLNAIAIGLVRKNILVVTFEKNKYFNKALKSIFSKLKGLAKQKH